MERIKHGNVLMTIDDENKQEALDCMFIVLVRLKQKMVKTF